MANAATGIWSAVGALLGGAVGAAAGHYAAQARPRTRYTKGRGEELEDAMVVGGASGAVVGAFLGGMLAGNDPAPPKLGP